MNNKIEILSPAGSMESLIAAVRSGADAVYLGAKEFSARASAHNFDMSQMKEAIDYCHIRGVKAYLTINTLMFDSELEKAVNLAAQAYSLGIDAVIVQDTGLAMLLRKHLPDLRLHGSTQMSIHTPSGAKALYEMGFSRVVLSRELSLSEIEEIRNACPIELEVFVHGALCMSVSGQCYFSAMLGSRSGNRGMCAQPCRLPFKVQGGSDHALSLKDNSLIEYLDKLQSLGVASAKIEGRMKRPEYVSAATSACQQMRDKGFVTEETSRYLNNVFSRSGFTDGYLCGKRSGDMFGHRRKEDVTAGSEKLLCEIRNSYKDETQRVDIEFEFTACVGDYPVLIVSDGEHTIETAGDILCEEAQKVALSEEKATALLQKCGGTPYKPNNIICNIGDNVSLPVSKINELRRLSLQKLSEARTFTGRSEYKELIPPGFHQETIPPLGKGGYAKSAEKITITLDKYNVPVAPIKRRARFTDTDIPEEFRDSDLLFVPLFSRTEDIKNLIDRGFPIAVETPRGMFGREENIKKALIKAKEAGVTHALASNIGAVYLAKELGFTVHGGFGLNFTNTAALMWAESMGIADTELSFELTKEQIDALGASIPRGIISYGYLPLMLTRACPGYTVKSGCKNCTKDKILQDRMNKKFIFTCDGNCTEVLNCVPLLIPDKINTFLKLQFHVFRYTVENSVEKVENIISFSSVNQNSAEFTRGLYYRGVK